MLAAGRHDRLHLLDVHPDEAVRTAIIDALASLPDAAVHELTELLASNQRMTRLSASLALAAAGDTSLKPLLDRLAEESGETRFWVVKALARLRNPVVVPILLELLEDEAFEVQMAAAHALSGYTLHEAAGRKLIEALDTENWRVRQAISESLAAQTQLPVSLFEKPLSSGSEHQRYWLTKVVGRLGTPEVVPMLVARFGDPAWPIRKNAAVSISKVGPAASRYLIEVLGIQNLDANLKFWVSRAMIGLEDPALMPTLIQLLADPDLSVRANASEAIDALGDRAVSYLLEALRVSTSRLLREGIARCLVRTGARHVESIASMFQFRDPEVNYWASQVLAQMGGPALAVLTKLVDEDDDRVRFMALSALGQMGSPEAIQTSIDFLTDRHLSVRRLAVENLGRMKAQEAVPQLCRMLETADSDMIGEILRALGAIGDPRAAPEVMKLLGHDRWEIRKEAVLATGQIGGDEARQTLTRILRQERTPEMLVFLVRAAGQAGAQEVVPLLMKLLERGDDVALESLSALGRLGAKQAVDHILPLLETGSWEVKRSALRALARIGGPIDLTRLRSVISGDDLVLRHEAWETLKSVLGARRWEELLGLTVQRSLREPADELFGEASGLLKEKKHDEALKVIKKALRLSKRPEYYGLMGSIHLELQNMNQAIKSLKRSVAGRADPVIACKLAVAYFLSRDYRRALVHFRQVLRLADTPQPVRELAQSSIKKIQDVLK
ncbi:MAG: HEAT repeat domain-containing protein [Candidatus Riflebacteria bacterium]|nr:HEAT repeat domain-containing protein [Candidatus Riflebacteria bacterium]